MLTRSKPIELAELAIIGSLLLATMTYLGLLLRLGVRRAYIAKVGSSYSHLTLLVVVSLLPAACGALMLGLARWRIYNGLIENKWTDDELLSAHQWLYTAAFKRFMKVVLLTTFFTWIAVLIYCTASYVLKRYTFDEACSLFMLTIFLSEVSRTLNALRAKFRPEPPTPPYDPSKSLAATMKPLHSDQWGQTADR